MWIDNRFQAITQLWTGNDMYMCEMNVQRNSKTIHLISIKEKKIGELQNYGGVWKIFRIMLQFIES